MNPHQNALLHHADRHARMVRGARIAGWIAVYGLAICFVWMECYLHPIGGQ